MGRPEIWVKTERIWSLGRCIRRFANFGRSFWEEGKAGKKPSGSEAKWWEDGQTAQPLPFPPTAMILNWKKGMTLAIGIPTKTGLNAPLEPISGEPTPEIIS